jgi:hypothetical protein
MVETVNDPEEDLSLLRNDNKHFGHIAVTMSPSASLLIWLAPNRDDRIIRICCLSGGLEDLEQSALNEAAKRVEASELAVAATTNRNPPLEKGEKRDGEGHV